MADNQYLRIVYRTLAYGLGIIFVIALGTEAMSLPYNGGVPRLFGVILIGGLAIVWVWVASLGKEALREMA